MVHLLKKWIRKAFTHTEYKLKGKSKKIERVDVPPSEHFVYFMRFIFLALLSLVTLQTTCLIFLHEWSSEIFAAITSLIGAIVGAFIGAKK